MLFLLPAAPSVTASHHFDAPVCRYIGHVHVVLKDLKDVLPERVAPVVADMVKQLKRGQEKCCKYEDRSGWEGLIRAKSETVRFRYPHAFSDIHNNKYTGELISADTVQSVILATSFSCSRFGTADLQCLHGRSCKLTYFRAHAFPQLLSTVQEKLSLISGQIEQLLALLTASASASKATSDAAGELQRQAAQLQSTSQQAQTHLACMSDALKIMGDEAAKAADVDVALRQLQGTMLEVGDQAAQEVQRACSEVLRRLSQEIGTLIFSVEQLQGTMKEMAEDLKSLQVKLDALGQQVTAEGQLTREAVQDGMASIIAVRS